MARPDVLTRKPTLAETTPARTSLQATELPVVVLTGNNKRIQIGGEFKPTGPDQSVIVSVSTKTKDNSRKGEEAQPGQEITAFDLTKIEVFSLKVPSSDRVRVDSGQRTHGMNRCC